MKEATRSSGSGAGTTLTATFTIPPEAMVVQAAPPDLLSQHNVEAATGIPSRVFLATIRADGFPVRVLRLGKLRLVGRVAFLSWLDGQPKSARPSTICATATDPDYHEFLARAGLERKPGH